ncbi:hypothetical protein M426DRAFT_266964 [Hypoxylon sp. CI-4A]|nr:hypothetical protein M426DRAFT_266964 [Hypoxylon sp. CI-4A]
MSDANADADAEVNIFKWAAERSYPSEILMEYRQMIVDRDMARGGQEAVEAQTLISRGIDNWPASKIYYRDNGIFAEAYDVVRDENGFHKTKTYAQITQAEKIEAANRVRQALPRSKRSKPRPEAMDQHIDVRGHMNRCFYGMKTDFDIALEEEVKKRKQEQQEAEEKAAREREQQAEPDFANSIGLPGCPCEMCHPPEWNQETSTTTTTLEGSPVTATRTANPVFSSPPRTPVCQSCESGYDTCPEPPSKTLSRGVISDSPLDWSS